MGTKALLLNGIKEAGSKLDDLAMDYASRMQEADIPYIHNVEKNPYKKSSGEFAMDVEPSGQYFTPMDSLPDYDLGESYIKGTKQFKKPLVVDFGGSYSDASNWKRKLSEQYGGKKGKALTNAIRKDGYDAVLTVDEAGGLSEAVDLYKGKGGVDMASKGAGFVPVGGALTGITALSSPEQAMAAQRHNIRINDTISPNEPITGGIANLIDRADRATMGSPANLLIPTGIGDFMRNVSTGVENDPLDYGFAALDVIP